MQVTLFSAACFLIIGLRGGAWEPSLFVAVPVVVCFFSYMFCVCVLLGLVTRSTLAALLLTLLFWFLTWGVGTAELVLLAIRTEQKHGNFPPGTVQIQPPGDRNAGQPFAGDWPPSRPPKVDPAPAAERSADDDTALKRGGKVPLAIGRSLLKAIAEPSSPDERSLAKGPKQMPLEASKFNPEGNTPDPDKEAKSSAKLKLAHDIVFGLKTVLPKTTETIGLLERSLYDMADLPEGALGQPTQNQKSQRELVETVRNRSAWWIVGTSLGFEAVVLCLAAFIFCRRDY